MTEELKNLRAKIAALKAAPIFNKAGLAEQAMDAALVVIERLDVRNNVLNTYVETLGDQFNRIKFVELVRQNELIARHYDSHLKLLGDVLKLSNEIERIKNG